MNPSATHRVRYGALTAYLHVVDHAVDLLPVVAALPKEMPHVWLDTARQHPVTGRWSLLGYAPWLTCIARDGRTEVTTQAATRVTTGDPFDVLKAVLRAYRIPALRQPHARALALMGWISYDANRWIERLPAPLPDAQPQPDLVWYGMRVTILVDHGTSRTWLVSLADPHVAPPVAEAEARDALEEARARCAYGMADQQPLPATRRVAEVTPTSTPHEFHRMVERALEAIRAGEIFQANVAQRFIAAWEGPTLPLYARLRRVNPSPFAAYVRTPQLTVVSCSPERLVRIQEGRVDTRPIAGTRPRGASAAEDAVNSLELLLSEKERAEHLMLVDLERNDLGRIARTGSVGVNELMGIEAYSHVMHIVSDISCRLAPRRDAVDVIRAVFPGGTITGCPKVRCMQLLREIEPVARGLYTGAIGYLGFDGTSDLNIAIRTMLVQEGRLSFHAGAGIVADSDPEREYHETLAKAKALLAALQPEEATAP